MKNCIKPFGICFLSLLLACALLLGGCEQRQPQGPAPASRQDFLQEEGGVETDPPGVPSVDEPKDEPPPEGIDDPELVEQARLIVLEALDRADVCDTIYQGKIKYESYMDPIQMEDNGYYLVLDERFLDIEDVQDYWMSTFSLDNDTAAKAYADMQEALLYYKINGELYVKANATMPRLTMGEWDVTTMRLLEMGDTEIQVWMETTLAGLEHGGQILRLVRSNGNWLLDESFFL